MKSPIAFAFAALLLAATTGFAQDPELIQYQPVTCIVPNQLALLQLGVAVPGEIRAYFRHVNTTEWCWVQGNNYGPASTVVLPEFHPGDEVEYFFVVLDKKRVIAKSPVLYRARTDEHCQTLIARHSFEFAVDCTHEVSGTANSFMAGNAVTPKDVVPPPHISPDTPEQQK